MSGWKKIVGTVAPALAGLLTGGNPLAMMATRELSKKLLGKEDATEEEIERAVSSASPETLLKIKEAERDLKIGLANVGVKLEEVAAGDRHSARQREIATGDKATPRVLAGAVVFGFLASVYLVLSGYVDGLKDPTTAGIVGTMIGYVSAKADQVVSYYFGSSAGSARKNDLLAAKN